MKSTLFHICVSLASVLAVSQRAGVFGQMPNGHGVGDRQLSAYFSSNLKEMEDAPLTFDSPPPSWIKGTLIRNGLGRFEVGSRKFLNALDAYAKLASWKFPGNGTAFFTTKMVQSDSYKEAVNIDDIAPYMLLDKTDPSFNLAQEMECMKNGLDNANVNVFNFGGENLDFVIVSDFWKVYTIDPYTLETKKWYSPPIPDAPFVEYPVVLSSAHPVPENGTSNYLTYVSLGAMVPEQKSKYLVARTKSSGEREIITTIEVDKISYMHSFAATENYVILVATPFYVDPIAIFKDLKPLSAFKWEKDGVTKFYVVNLKTKEVKTLKTENMFFLHVVNSYESNIFEDEIIVDICTYKNTSGLFEFNEDNLSNPARRAAESQAILKRYTLNLHSNEVSILEYGVTSSVPYVNGLDFPTINENYRYKKYCYIYGVVYNYDGHDFLHTALVKKDVCTGKNEFSYVPQGKLLNEAFFVPRPGSTEEDDGVLITPITDSFTNTSTINIFSAKNLTLLSSAMLPTSIPFGTHGRFFDYIL